jgi:hypothetical protein
MRPEVAQKYNEIAIASVSMTEREILLAPDEAVHEQETNYDSIIQSSRPLLSRLGITDPKTIIDSSYSMISNAELTDSEKSLVVALGHVVARARIRQELISREDNMRAVIEHVYQGLDRSPLEGIFASFKGVVVYTKSDWTMADEQTERLKDNRNFTFSKGSINSFEAAIGSHPITLREGTVFAASIAIRAAQLFSPDVIELTIEDQTRVPMKISMSDVIEAIHG